LYRWISLLVVADTVMADTAVPDSADATRLADSMTMTEPADRPSTPV
jgi:hypothetical protein